MNLLQRLFGRKKLYGEDTHDPGGAFSRANWYLGDVPIRWNYKHQRVQAASGRCMTLDQFKHCWAAVRLCRKTSSKTVLYIKTSWGTMDTPDVKHRVQIFPSGDAEIGCHQFKYAEILRLAQFLGLPGA